MAGQHGALQDLAMRAEALGLGAICASNFLFLHKQRQMGHGRGGGRRVEGRWLFLLHFRNFAEQKREKQSNKLSEHQNSDVKKRRQEENPRPLPRTLNSTDSHPVKRQSS